MISRSPKRCRHGVVRTKGPIVRVSNSTSLRVMFMAAPHRADWCQNSLTRHPCGKVRNTSMKDGTLIVFTGDKGGVGKSTLAVLMTEWFLSQGKQVHLVDADPNQTSKIWTEKCEALGYKANFPETPMMIVDTAGTSGSSLKQYI